MVTTSPPLAAPLPTEPGPLAAAAERGPAQGEGPLVLSSSAVATVLAVAAAMWGLLAWLLVAVGIFGRGLGHSEVGDRALVALLTLALVALPVLVAVQLRGLRSLRLDATGAHRHGWRTPISLPWSEVTRIELRSGQRLHLRSRHASVTLPLGLCRNPMRVMACVLDRLREHGRL